MTEETNKGGRPSIFTIELAYEICDRTVRGESMRKITGEEDMPASSTVYKWLSEKPEFSEHYARAKEWQAEGLAEEIIDISDAAMTDAVQVGRAKLRCDNRKWIASKLLPKKYGDKLGLGLQTPDGEPIDTININIVGKAGGENTT